MTICQTCKLDVFNPCGSHHANNNEKLIVVACDNELRRPAHFARMAIACANLNVSRRAFINDIANTIYLYQGSIRWPEGPDFTLKDTSIEDAFNDDLSFRWLSDFFRIRIESQRKPQYRLIPRLRLIDTYFLIQHPTISRHFYR